MQEQEAKLQQEILQDARKKAERTIDRARKECAKLKSAVESQQAQERETLLAQAGAEAAIKTRSILAGIRHDIQKQWLRSREAVIGSVFQEALTQLTAGHDIDRPLSLKSLLEEAIQTIGLEKGLQISCRPEEATVFTPEQLAEIAGRNGGADGLAATWRLKPDPALTGGLVVTSADGRRRVDQTYSGRLNRRRQQLRNQVEELIEIPHEKIERLLKESDVHE